MKRFIGVTVCLAFALSFVDSLQKRLEKQQAGHKEAPVPAYALDDTLIGRARAKAVFEDASIHRRIDALDLELAGFDKTSAAFGPGNSESRVYTWSDLKATYVVLVSRENLTSSMWTVISVSSRE